MPPRRDTAAGGLRLPLRLEHGGVERFARGLARPDDELEGGKVTLAGIERGREQRLALPARRHHPPRPREGVAGHHLTVLGPGVRMPHATPPPARTGAWRYMARPSWVQRSKCPTYICSLISETSCCTSAWRRSGTFSSNAQARCSASMSNIQV